MVVVFLFCWGPYAFLSLAGLLGYKDVNQRIIWKTSITMFSYRLFRSPSPLCRCSSPSLPSCSMPSSTSSWTQNFAMRRSIFYLKASARKLYFYWENLTEKSPKKMKGKRRDFFYLFFNYFISHQGFNVYFLPFTHKENWNRIHKQTWSDRCSWRCE